MAFTREQVVNVLDQIVEEYGPDYSYSKRYVEITGSDYAGFEDCQYFVEGRPGCIVGEVLHRLNVEIDPRLNFAWNSPWNASYGGPNSGEQRATAADEAKNITLLFDDGATAVLTEAQRMQDEQHTWGESVDRAKAVR